MNYYRSKILLFTLILAVFLPGSLLAANFTLSPVRLFFQPNQKTDIINIKNNSNEDIKLQVSSFAWSQDENTKDVISKTKDLIAFPKLLSIPPGETRLLRIGNRTNASNKEKLYRIYIEELPGSQKSTNNQTSIRTLTKAGIPVFIRPHTEKTDGNISKISLDKGTLNVSFSNNGNVHFMIRSVRVKGMDKEKNTIIEREMAGWYLHPENSKIYNLTIPKEECIKLNSIETEITTDSFTASEHLNVIASMCGT